MCLCDGGGSERHGLDARKMGLKGCAQVGFDDFLDGWEGQGRHPVPESGQGRREIRWDDVQPERGELPCFGKGPFAFTQEVGPVIDQPRPKRLSTSDPFIPRAPQAGDSVCRNQAKAE